jgi:hypothetical protein
MGRADHRAAYEELLRRYVAPYWYLIPLSLPALSIAASIWPRSRATAAALVIVVTIAYIFIGWLNTRHRRHAAISASGRRGGMSTGLISQD